MKARVNPTGSPSSRPTTDWARLMQDTIVRAQRVRPGWVPGLQAAQTKGQSEIYLRRLGILSPVDIDREMPLALSNE